MAVDITIDDELVTHKVSGYSVSEDSTPTSVTDMTGGVGQLTINLEAGRDARHARRRSIKLVDTEQGVVSGRVSSVNDPYLNASVTADSRMISLVAERSAEPYAGTLEGCFLYYLSLVGITSGVAVDSAVATIPVLAPGWSGSVWDAIKRLCVAHQVETALVSDNVVLRPIRTRLATNHRNTQSSVAIDDSNTAQSIILHYLRSVRNVTDLAFPLGGWNPEVQTFNVKAGETIEFPIDLKPTRKEGGLGASLRTVIQPTCVDFVGREVTGQSVYCVAGNDGKPITAAQWLNTGGNLEVKIGADSQSLTVVVTGSSIEEYGPYRIAATSGSSNFYSSLRICGTGVFYDRQKIELATGNSADDSPTEIGAEVENDFVVGDAAGMRAAMNALFDWTGPTVSTSVTTRGINRVGDNGSAAYPTFATWDSIYPTQTFDQIDTLWPTQDLDALSAYFLQLVSNDFENQAFGNIGGARVNEGTFFARIRSASTGPASVSYQASMDTTFDDWNAFYGPVYSFGDLNALLPSSWNIGDLTIEPLIS